MKTTFSIIANSFSHATFQCIVSESWDSGCEKYCFKKKKIYLEKASKWKEQLKLLNRQLRSKPALLMDFLSFNNNKKCHSGLQSLMPTHPFIMLFKMCS